MILEIDIDSVVADPTERDPPVAAGIDGKAAFSVADQHVKAKPGQVHILRRGRDIESAQDTPQSRYIVDIETACLSGFEEPLQSLASK